MWWRARWRRRPALELTPLGFARIVEVLVHIDPVAMVNAAPTHVFLDVWIVLDVASRLRSIATQRHATVPPFLVTRGEPMLQKLRLGPVTLFILAVAVVRQQVRIVEGVAFDVFPNACADPPLCQATGCTRAG